MPHLLQDLFAPSQAMAGDARETVAPPAADEDMAIGWESALPALQFEGWEPAAVPASGAAAY